MLSADKQYLVESRLLPVARKPGFAGLGDLVVRCASARDDRADDRRGRGDDHQRIVLFPRQDSVRSFPHRRSCRRCWRRAARSRTIRIWCAAASTGQEPYSLAMCLKEMERGIAGWRIEILATDLSNDVLEKARQGLYSQFEVQRGLPIQLLIKHFTQVGELWQIAPDIRAHGQIPAAQSAVRLFPARHVRFDLLPQRTDLFRSADQDRRAQPPVAQRRCRRRLSGARRRRNRGRA